MGIQDYSTTPANNTALFPEGMARSAVNDSARQVQADLRVWYNDSQWVIYGDGDGSATVLFATGTSFTVQGVNVTAAYHAGRRVKAVGTLTGTIFGTISSSSFSTNTTVNVAWDSGTLQNETLTIYLAALSATGSSVPSTILSNPLTNRGDIVKRGVSVPERLAIGAAETILSSDGTDPLWADKRASAAEFRTGTTETKYLTPKRTFDAMAEVSLSDGANISLDLSTGYDFTVTLGGNRTLDNPTNVKVGQRGRIRVVQDGTGGRTLSFGTNYEFEGGTAPTLSTAASAQDILYYDCISATRILVHFVANIS